MSQLIRSESNGRSGRVVRRDLARLDGHGRLELAAIEQAAQLQGSRVDAVAYVGRRALHEAAMLSHLEEQLSVLVPSASNRLQALGDLTAMAMAEVLAATSRKVRHGE